jgi:predicted TIM-barrel fold metal-dependent hydrolase
MFAAATCSNWLHAKVAARFPQIKICLTEGGIGWVPILLDRLDAREGVSDALFPTWAGEPYSAEEVLRRNFWFCLLDEHSSIPLLDRIGPDRVMFEVDYPHLATNWPDTQPRLREVLKGLSPFVIERITWRNASEVYNHPIPLAVQRDPSAY